MAKWLIKEMLNRGHDHLTFSIFRALYIPHGVMDVEDSLKSKAVLWSELKDDRRWINIGVQSGAGRSGM